MKSQFHHIGIVIRPHTPHIPESVGALADFLLGHGIEVYLDIEAKAELLHLPCFAHCQSIEKKRMGKKCDLVISFGGDGTLLSIARKIAPYRVPLIGVNRGSLGFLTQVPHEDTVAEISNMLTGKYVAEERIMLETSVMRDGEEIHHSLALNDVVFSRGGMGQMIEFEVFINRDFVYTQRSDGLIVSTPTGSTAYALAAGGPILQPTLRALTLVPICPQSMNNRPIAVSDAGEIEVLITKGWDARVHFDGQSYCDLHNLDRIVIRRYRNSMRMLHPADYNYFRTLRQKLHWGEQLI
ncbi:MAG: NAD(+) kinase [Neisseria sp.]|nr:NAD(+) kinase [Neisseria sp.]